MRLNIDSLFDERHSIISYNTIHILCTVIIENKIKNIVFRDYILTLAICIELKYTWYQNYQVDYCLKHFELIHLS